jgi:hypothetical protein
MTYFVVDIESDGPVTPQYSMVLFGAVVLAPSLTETFFGKVRPISEEWLPKALAVSHLTREETLLFPPPEVTIPAFVGWVEAHTEAGKRPVFVSDNTGFDFSFMNFYLWKYAGRNPFGHTSRNISDLYKGMERDVASSFWSLKQTKHTHHPVDDAMGNAEALLAMRELGLRLPL